MTEYRKAAYRWLKEAKRHADCADEIDAYTADRTGERSDEWQLHIEAARTLTNCAKEILDLDRQPSDGRNT